MKKKPNFFIVGAPRCATTAMNTYLKQHPDIFMANKESHFFAKDHHADYVIEDAKQYFDLFLRASDENRIGEASVNYLYSKVAASNIKQFCPEAKIIIMLRNPIDMLCSLYNHYVYAGGEDIFDFEVGLNADEDRKNGSYKPANRCFSGEYYSYKDMVKFTTYVGRYLDIFGSENVLIVIYDDFIKNTGEIYKRTLEFLDVSVDFDMDFKVINSNRNIRSRTLQRILINSNIRSFVGKLIPHQLMIYCERFLKRINTSNTGRPPMSEDLRKKMQMEFAPEVESLSKLLEMDLTYWNSV